MAVGGPAIGFTAGLLEGLARARQHAIASNRFQVEFALKQLKERKQEEEAIRKEWAAYQKAQIEYAAAQRELDLATEHRRQVETSTGKPYRDAAIEGRLAEAHERLDDAHNDLQERQGKLQDLISERDARVRGALKSPMAPKIGENVGGLFGSRVGRHAATEDDRQKAIDERKAEIRKGEMEQQAEFNKSANPVEREIRQAQASESMENAKIKGFETAEEEGRKQQGPLNEETRRDKLYASDKEIEGIRQRRDVYNASMEAAAQEIQRRQAGLGPMPQLPPGPGGSGAATGKGGGTGGLLGPITGKGGAMAQPPTGMGGPSQGMGSPGAFQGVPGAMQGYSPSAGSTGPGIARPPAGPTVGQALSPVAGKLLQMPLPQAIATIRSVLGGTPPAGFAGKGSFGAGAMGQAGTRSPRTSEQSGAMPRQGSGGTTHFHFHQAKASPVQPSGSRAQVAAPTAQPPTGMQGQSGQYAAPMPPRRPDFQGQGGTTLEPSYQPTRRAMDEPAMEWYHAHPEVPESEAGKYAPHDAPAQAPTRLPAPDAGTIMNGYRFKGGNPRDKASWEQAPAGAD